MHLHQKPLPCSPLIVLRGEIIHAECDLQMKQTHRLGSCSGIDPGAFLRIPEEGGQQQEGTGNEWEVRKSHSITLNTYGPV